MRRVSTLLTLYSLFPTPKGNKFYPSNERGGGSSFRFTDDIEQPVHPVGEIDIGVSGRAEHHVVTRRAAARGVAGAISPAAIRFRFHNARADETRSRVSDERHTEKRLRNKTNVAREKISAQAMEALRLPAGHDVFRLYVRVSQYKASHASVYNNADRRKRRGCQRVIPKTSNTRKEVGGIATNNGHHRCVVNGGGR